MSALWTWLRLLLATLILIAAVPVSATTQLETKLSALAQRGSGEAAYHLGMLYHMGLSGVPKNSKKAFELFKISTARGDPLGAYKLGCFYDGQGEGVTAADPTLALKYKMIAAEAGYSLAQQDVARHLFAQGDKMGGIRWLEAAAAQGDSMALMALSSLYSGAMPEGFPAPPKDTAKSLTYFLLAVRDTPEMRQAVESEARKKLSKQEYANVMKAAAEWRARPSPLDQKADQGLGAAYALTGLPAPSN